MPDVPDRPPARCRGRERWLVLVLASLLVAAAPATEPEVAWAGALEAGASAAGDAGPAASGTAPPVPPSPSPALPPGLGGAARRWQRPSVEAVLTREAGRLGLDEAALARIRAVAAAARPERDARERALRDERQALRALLHADAPDRDAVMRQLERVGAAETALEKERMATLLEIRQLLSPDQRVELVKIFRERKQARGRSQGGGDDAAEPSP